MSENTRHELIIGGTGGQGVITIGYTLAAAASGVYHYVTRFPIYLATMRGGPAYCTVIFSNQEIAAPILSHTDNAIAMESGAYARLKKEIKPTSSCWAHTAR
jgi:2-oxoglutarate ferredoxin oxidoreductase subunit gamma